MVSKIKFVYSWPYDAHYKELYKKKKYPSGEKIGDYIQNIEKIWKNQGDRILKELEKTSGLKFKEKEIKCYVVGYCIPFSNPLTLPVYSKKEDFVDMLTHELIHQLFIQNWNKSKRLFKKVEDKYPQESYKTKVHILVYRIHKKFYENMKWQKRMQRDIKCISQLPDYKKAWDIVLRED